MEQPKVTAKYTELRLCPVGYPVLYPDATELKRAIRDILIGLSFMHELGFVHRDIRWENVVKDWSGSFVVIDLENAGKEGPVSYHSPRWPETDNQEVFTKSMDMMMVGTLIDKYASTIGLNEDDRNFITQLATVTPANAINHVWLRGVGL